MTSLALLSAPLVAATARATGTTDVAIVRTATLVNGVAVTSASRGAIVDFVFIGRDLGPDAVSGSMDVGALCFDYEGSTSVCGFQRHVRLVQERCDPPVSPDTPQCEYGQIAVGATTRAMLSERVIGAVGSMAAVRACATTEDAADWDANLDNNCQTASVAITP